MELDEAKKILTPAIRSELRDHAFGDAEVFWYLEDLETKGTTQKVFAVAATGYFSRNTKEVTLTSGEKFLGKDADELRECGVEGQVDRNDETGPEEYVEGYTMPGLTKEAVYHELFD